MSKRLPVILLVVTAALFFAGISELLRMRFSRGDVFPVYSTYRADPLGTRALYESLEIVPGLRVQRWLRDTEKLPSSLDGTLVFAGMDRQLWESMPEAGAARLDALVRGGARLVVTFTAGFEERELKRWRSMQRDSDDYPDVYDLLAPPARMDAYKSKRTPPEKPEAPDTDAREPEENAGAGAMRKKFADPGERWGVRLATRRVEPGEDGGLPPALRAANDDGGRGLPASLYWLSELYFEPDNADSGEWRTVYTRENRPVLIERRLGAGSIVLGADSFFLSNEALQRARATPLLSWLVVNARGGGLVVFDEHHLGMEEDGGVAVLARRYGLGGAACVLALLAALWIWRRMALFVPPSDDADGEHKGYDPTAGLEALLRRSVPRAQLAGVCVAEWKKTAGAADVARVEKALAALPKNATPESVFEAAREALRKR